MLARWRGRPLIGHVADLVRAALDEGLVSEALVVLPDPPPEAIRTLVTDAGFRTVLAAGASRGLDRSLRSGFDAMSDTDAAMVFLADQPAVRLTTVAALLAAARPIRAALARPRYRSEPETPGHPVLIGRHHWDLVASATSDRGLGPAVATQGLTWQVVDIDGSNPDVDTAADLDRLRAHPSCE